MKTNSIYKCSVRERYFLNEIQSWERSIEFMLLENAHMKNRLADILDVSGFDIGLDKAEYYQAQFLKNDELLLAVLHQINNQLLLVHKKNIATNYLNDKNLNLMQLKLRIVVENSEKNFSSLRIEFNNFLLSALPVN